jgi:hypothetical protein
MPCARGLRFSGCCWRSLKMRLNLEPCEQSETLLLNRTRQPHISNPMASKTLVVDLILSNANSKVFSVSTPTALNPQYCYQWANQPSKISVVREGPKFVKLSADRETLRHEELCKGSFSLTDRKSNPHYEGNEQNSNCS